MVTGQVQGVFYRASARRQAESLGITGWARNLPDGSVEVVACGDTTSLGELKRWLMQGPPAARVTAVACEVLPYQEPVGFVTC
jgi:acylphosphatase